MLATEVESPEAAQFANADGVRRSLRRVASLFKPPPDLKPSEWAERNVYIPAGNAIPGQYRVANAPYQREPMDMMVHPDCYRVSLMWGAQIGKTLAALCVQGYAIEMRPRSQMMMQPSQGDVQTWLETKFNPLVESSPAIARRIAKPRGRDGVNNQRMKSYPGGFLMMAWSGSPRTMRGRSAPLIVCDEVDGYQRTDEGHPVSLLWQRSATFGDERFLFEISTPTIKGESYIEDSFEAGDQRFFHVRCPHCEELQRLRWENVTWIGRQSTSVKDADADLAHDTHDLASVAYACEACGELWNDGQRCAAIRNAEAVGGGWIATKEFKGHASYHCWEGYSLFRKLSDIVRDYLDKLRADDLQTFVNVSLSQTWELQGERIDATTLEGRAAEFPADVPAGGVYLTAGIDMQIDRLEVEVVAWGIGEQSWSIGYHVLWGDPLAGDVFDELDDLLATTYMHETGAPMRIMAACFDTGGTSGYTQAAYDYLRGKTGRRLFGIKGVGGWGRPIVEKAQRKQSGKNARKVDLFLVGTDEAKAIVQRRLAIAEPGPGYCHVPSDRYDVAEWAKQMTAEKLVVRYVKGQPVREWHKHDKARNEAGDCRVYAFAALKIMAPPLRRLAEKMAAHPRAQATSAANPAAAIARSAKRPAPAPEAATEEAPAPRNQTKRIARSPAARRGGWVNRWK